jgi:hypothetical protein
MLMGAWRGQRLCLVKGCEPGPVWSSRESCEGGSMLLFREQMRWFYDLLRQRAILSVHITRMEVDLCCLPDDITNMWVWWRGCWCYGCGCDVHRIMNQLTSKSQATFHISSPALLHTDSPYTWILSCPHFSVHHTQNWEYNLSHTYKCNQQMRAR